MKFILEIAAGVAIGTAVGQLLIELFGLLLEWAGRFLVKTFVGAVKLIAEQRQVATTAAAEADAADKRKLVRE